MSLWLAAPVPRRGPISFQAWCAPAPAPPVPDAASNFMQGNCVKMVWTRNPSSRESDHCFSCNVLGTISESAHPLYDIFPPLFEQTQKTTSWRACQQEEPQWSGDAVLRAPPLARQSACVFSPNSQGLQLPPLSSVSKVLSSAKRTVPKAGLLVTGCSLHRNYLPTA